MPLDWPLVKLGDVVNQITVGWVGPMSKEYRPQGIPFLRSLNVRPLRIDLSDVRYIGAEFHNRISKSRLGPGDVVVVRTGDPGTVAVIPSTIPEANCADLVVIRPGEKVNPDYLAYFLSSTARNQIHAHVVGAVQQHFNIGSARDLLIPLPSRAEQDRVAALVTTIDGKIAVNRRVNQSLTELTTTLFKSWCVDFDPVTAKAADRVPPGVPAELARLFPSTFREAEFGPIPEGWRIDGLDSLATFQNGLAMQKYPPDESGSLPVVKIAELRAGSVNGSDRASNVPSEAVIDDGDVVFSWSGSLLVRIWCGGRAALNQHLFKVTSKHFPKWFYYLWTLEHLQEFQNIAADKRTTMGHIKRHHLRDAKVFIPAPELLAEMGKVFEPAIERMQLNEVENGVLGRLRDALLPRLLSGQLQLKPEKAPTETSQR